MPGEDRPAEIGFEFETALCLGGHFGSKRHRLARPQTTGGALRRVRFAQDCRNTLMRPGQRVTNPRLEETIPPEDFEWSVQELLKPICEILGRVSRVDRHNHRKGIARKPRHHPVAAHDLLQAIGNADQGVIAVHVSETRVQVADLVDIDKED